MKSVISFILRNIYANVQYSFASSIGKAKFFCESSWNLSKFVFQKAKRLYKFSPSSKNIIDKSKILASNVKKIYDLTKESDSIKIKNRSKRITQIIKTADKRKQYHKISVNNLSILEHWF